VGVAASSVEEFTKMIQFSNDLSSEEEAEFRQKYLQAVSSRNKQQAEQAKAAGAAAVPGRAAGEGDN
jgi:hypothetical protein